MLRKYLIIFITLFTITAIPQVDRSKKPEPGPAPEIKLAGYESFTLENGLKVFVVEDEKLPGISYSLVVDRDPIIEGEDAGYVSMAGQLLRTGTETRMKDQLDEDIDFIGATLSTSSTSVYGYSLKKHTEKLIELMSDVVLHTVFKQEELDKIKIRTKSSLAQEKDDPNAIAGKVRDVVLYGKNHPYGEVVTEETVDNITLEMCKNYYDKYFKPNISYLSIVGDISVDDAKDLVKKYFGSWEKVEVPTHQFTSPESPDTNNVILVDRPNSVQSVIHIAYPIELKPGDKDVIAASLVNTMLGGSFRSRLNQKLREEKAYTYGARSVLNSDKLTGYFDAYAEVRNEVTDSAVADFLNEMEKIKNEKVSEKELQETINYVTGSFARSLESPQTIANFAINIERYNLPKDYYKNYLQNVAAVTVDDINSMAEKYINPYKSDIIIVGNSDEVSEGLKKFGEIKYYNIEGDEIDKSMLKVPSGLTGKDVINNYIKAIGGTENINNVQDRKTIMEGKVQGVNVKMTVYQKQPDMLKQVVKAGAMNQELIYNGEKATMEFGGNKMDITGSELERLKYEADLHFITKLNENNVEVSLTGMEKVDGKDAYKIEMKIPSGTKWIQYYDPETGLKVKETKTITSPQGTFNQETYYSDYQEVNGVKYPHKIKQSLGTQSLEFNVKEIEVNKGIVDREFEID